ncbi:MAG: hypothetical protein ACYC8V_05520 [Caulobacteraceae bacterium]
MTRSGLLNDDLPPAKRPVALALAAVLATGGFAAATTAPAAVISQSRAVGPASFVGTVNLKSLASRRSGGPAPLNANKPGKPGELHVIPLHQFRSRPLDPALLARALAKTPVERPSRLGASIASVGSFNGLDHYDQRILADNGNQFSLEPPDQALAVGNGFIVESVNDAIMVYDHLGNPLLSAPVSMNIFFNQDSAINRGYGNQRGPSLSDPRAYYDAATGRFFVAEWATLNDAAGNPLYISVQFLAVSLTSDPTGSWYIYSYETTNANTPGCPCLPDFNMMGIDANGVYISNNLFSIGGSGSFQGNTIYGLPKAALESGSSVTISQFAPLANDFSIHPAVTPPRAAFATESHGTEYAVEAVDDLTNNGLANSVNVWAISETNSLNTSSPALTLTQTSVATQTTNAVLPPAVEPDGPRPLGGPSGYNDPVPMLNPDDGRFSAVPYYVKGQIYATASTAVERTNNKGTKTAVATFIINASGGGEALSTSLASQSIISAPGNTSLLYPALAVNAAGQAAIGVTVVGAHTYPSAAVILTSTFGPPTINVSAAATLPDDGFTAYPQAYPPANGVGRWGDYGEGAVSEAGAFFLANEWIPPVTNAHPRSSFANWGTYITHVKP